LVGRPRESVEQFSAAIRLQPDLTEAHANLAVACQALGRYPEALAAAERARELARAAGQGVLVSQLDGWIAACRARAGPAAPSP
jgi:tetratricopeptide (TPR) repeat protein